jgi:septum formation protein
VRPLVLASTSPRRRRLLRQLGVAFSVRAPKTDERPLPGESPRAHVRRLALEKARAVARALPAGCGARWVLGADTVIALDGGILGKPRGARDAARMLARLAGRSHEVLTGVALVPVGGGRARVAVVRSRVAMKPFDAGAVRRYVATGEPLDKAGAYAVQGRGRRLVASVSGSLTNVVGLPLERLAVLLVACGLSPAPSTLSAPGVTGLLRQGSPRGGAASPASPRLPAGAARLRAARRATPPVAPHGRGGRRG